MPKPLDLTNEVFGNWKVLRKGSVKNGKVYWVCQCQKCGIEREVQGCSLRNGKSKGCGKCPLENNSFEGQEKICEICGQKFIPIKYGHGRKYCFNCNPIYSDPNRGKAISYIRKAVKKQLIEYKGGKCEKCGYNTCQTALHFHHTNPEEKDFSISDKLQHGYFKMEELFKEVDKCQLLCANCHAEEHERLDLLNEELN